MTYAYVQDVAEEWENYERLAAALGDRVPDGLIIHVAGPTVSGFRIIDVWESPEAWERFRNERLRPAVRSVAGDASVEQPIFRDLQVVHVVRPVESADGRTHAGQPSASSPGPASREA